jgi:hypothetical protein
MTTGRINQVTTERSIGPPESGTNTRLPTLRQSGVILWFGGPTAQGACPSAEGLVAASPHLAFLSTEANVAERVPNGQCQSERSRRLGRLASQQTFSSPRARQPVVLAADIEYVFASHINTGFPSCVASCTRQQRLQAPERKLH